MDSKIILAVLVVALIGIVAATYPGESNDIMNSLANVATEDSNAVKTVTDLAEASGNEINSVQVDESIVQPDSSVNSKVVSTQKSSKNNQKIQNNQGSSPNNQGTSSNNQETSSNDQSNSNNNNASSSSGGITETEAMSIAKNSLPSGMTSDYQKVTETNINGEKYYDVNLYKDGEIIAYAEINSKGIITGGAIKGETPEV